MAFKIVAIFVILVSWSALLSANSIGCGGFTEDVSKRDYPSLIPEIQRRCKRSFCSDDITCFKVASVGYDKNYCVMLTIPGDNGRTMECTVKWGSGSSSGSSSICSSNGAAFVTGGGSGSGRTRTRASFNNGPRNDQLGDSIRNKVQQKIAASFAKHGLPHNHGW